MYLNTHSCFSLRYGTLSLERIVEAAKYFNIQSLALTDINNSMAVPDFVNLCKQNNIKPLVGVEFRNDNLFQYTGIAKNNEGIRELNELLTLHNELKESFLYPAPDLSNVFFVYGYGKRKISELNENEFIGIKPSEVNKLYTSDYKKFQNKLIVWKTITFANEQDYELHLKLYGQ